MKTARIGEALRDWHMDKDKVPHVSTMRPTDSQPESMACHAALRSYNLGHMPRRRLMRSVAELQLVTPKQQSMTNPPIPGFDCQPDGHPSDIQQGSTGAICQRLRKYHGYSCLQREQPRNQKPKPTGRSFRFAFPAR